MKIDLLGSQPGEPSLLKVWQNVWNWSDPSNVLYEMWVRSSLFPDADFKNLWSGPADVIFNEVAFLVSAIYTECLRSYINAPIACQYNYYECGMRPLGD